MARHDDRWDRHSSVAKPVEKFKASDPRHIQIGEQATVDRSRTKE